MSLTVELQEEIVTLKARLNLEAARHGESIKIIEAIMPESQRTILLPGLPATKKELQTLFAETKAAKEEVSRREIMTMVRGDVANLVDDPNSE